MAPDTYHHYGASIYKYLRDNVFNEFQKFIKALWIMHVLNPIGIKAKQQVNMAVAIYLKQTDRMDYNFKNLDATK